MLNGGFERCSIQVLGHRLLAGGLADKQHCRNGHSAGTQTKKCPVACRPQRQTGNDSKRIQAEGEVWVASTASRRNVKCHCVAGACVFMFQLEIQLVHAHAFSTPRTLVPGRDLSHGLNAQSVLEVARLFTANDYVALPTRRILLRHAMCHGGMWV